MVVIENRNEKIVKVILTVAGIVLLFLAVFGAWYFWKLKNASADYVIPNVPYYGVYNHKDNNTKLVRDTASAVASILEYWNPGQVDFEAIGTVLGRTSDNKQTDVSPEIFDKIFESNGYSIEYTKLDISGLNKYLNSDSRTPLLFFQALDKDQPKELQYYPPSVLIGIKSSEKKLVLHSYWYGNNYEIGFDDFNALWGATAPFQRNYYAIIKPNNYDAVLSGVKKRANTPYSARTSIMKNAEFMFRNMALGEIALWRANSRLATEYYSKVEDDPEFQEYFPPYFKVLLYTQKSIALLRQKKIDSNHNMALELAQKAISLNHDLDKSFRDWPGFDINKNSSGETGILAEAYEALGDIYYFKGELEAAKESYEKALQIFPNAQRTKASLETTLSILSGKK
jgi:tetratricopeptide (TPR) repeat protein